MEIKENQVCYFIDDSSALYGGKLRVSYGLYVGRNVISGNYHIAQLTPWETRIINGVPFDRFQSEVKFKKVPKDWDYSKDLWETTHDEKRIKLFNANTKNKKITNPEDLQWLFDNGFLVRKKDVEPKIEAELDHGTYRIVKKCPAWTIVYGSHNDRYANKIFATYEKAQEELKEIEENKYKESVFYSWLDFYETLDWLLDKYEHDYGGKDLDKVRQKILSRPHLNNTIFRYYKGEILAMPRVDYNNKFDNWERIA